MEKKILKLKMLKARKSDMQIWPEEMILQAAAAYVGQESIFMLAPVSGEFPTIKTPQRDIAKRLKTEEENNSVFDLQPAEVQRHSGI